MGGRRSTAFLIGGTIALAAAITPVRAASWLEMNFWLSGPRYDGALPECEAALGTISHRFAKESRFWVSDLTIQTLDKVRQIAFRPWGPDVIPRRYCEAQALLSNGRQAKVYYSISENLGFIGASWGVEWCVVGYDRNLAFAPHCKMARP
jgi:hypothetical protein